MNNSPPCRIPAPPMDQFNYALQALGDQSMHMVISFRGLLDERRLMEAAASVLDEVPVLGSRFVGCDAPYWEYMTETNHAALIRIHLSSDPYRDLPRVLAIPVDPAAGPQICLHLLRTNSSDTLCITVHHAAMDAHGLLACTCMLAECYRNPDCKATQQTEHNGSLPRRGTCRVPADQTYLQSACTGRPTNRMGVSCRARGRQYP